jgi:hypothetical protein
MNPSLLLCVDLAMLFLNLGLKNLSITHALVSMSFQLNRRGEGRRVLPDFYLHTEVLRATADLEFLLGTSMRAESRHLGVQVAVKTVVQAH